MNYKTNIMLIKLNSSISSKSNFTNFLKDRLGVSKKIMDSNWIFKTSQLFTVGRRSIMLVSKDPKSWQISPKSEEVKLRFNREYLLYGALYRRLFGGWFGS